MLYPPTCVGFGTGADGTLLEVFLGSMGSPASLGRFVSRLRPHAQLISYAEHPTRFHGDVQNPARLPFSVAPSVMPRTWRCRNVSLLRIGYASRPRLSSRLTLGD